MMGLAVMVTFCREFAGWRCFSGRQNGFQGAEDAHGRFGVVVALYQAGRLQVKVTFLVGQLIRDVNGE